MTPTTHRAGINMAVPFRRASGIAVVSTGPAEQKKESEIHLRLNLAARSQSHRLRAAHASCMLVRGNPCRSLALMQLSAEHRWLHWHTDRDTTARPTFTAVQARIRPTLFPPLTPPTARRELENPAGCASRMRKELPGPHGHLSNSAWFGDGLRRVGTTRAPSRSKEELPRPPPPRSPSHSPGCLIAGHVRPTRTPHRLSPSSAADR